MADVTASLIEDLNLKISGSVTAGLAASTSSSYGTLSVTSAGLWTYTPKATVQTLRLGETVIDSGPIASKTYSINLRGDNDFATLGGAVKASIAEDKVLDVSGVLSVKDVDAGEAMFMSTFDSHALYGHFSFISGTGRWTYTPDTTKIQELKAKETAVEKLTAYSVDGSSIVVNVTLTGANDAAVISGTTLGADLKTNILARVTESDAALLSASGKLDITDADAASSSFQKLEKAGKLGWFSLAADGSWSYRADAMNSSIQKLFTSQSLSDTFVVKSADGLSSQAVTVFIDGVSDNSLGGRAAITAKAATPTLSGASVKSTITQLDSSLKLSLDDIADLPKTPQPGAYGYGTFLVAADGSWTYTLDYTKAAVIALPAGLTLTDTVLLGAVRLNVAITGINEVPTSISPPASASLTEDAGIVDGWLISSGSLSISDADTGESGFQKLVTSTATSLFSLAENGEWSFRIANSDAALQKLSAGKTLVKKFIAKSLDGKASSSVNITLNGSDTLTLSGDAGQTMEDQLQRTQGKLFSLDTGKALTASPALIEGQYGLFSIAKDGRWSYVQQKDLGEGTFTDSVQVSTPAGLATLKVTIHGSNDAAILSGNDGGDIGENGGSVTGTLTISDADLNESSFVASSSTGLYGSFALDAAGAWTYTPDDRADVLGNVTVTDSFLVYAADGASIPVVINVSGSNDAPLITSLASASGNEDTSISASVVVSDVDNTAFSYSVSTPTKGSVSINSSGLWTYAPSANSNGADSFTVTVFDGSGASVAQTINLTVNPVNDAPIITSLASASGNEDTSISASVVVSDVDNSSFSYSVSTPTKGSISINSSGLWTYAPSANSNGADSFTVTVSDGSGASVAQTINLTVNPVNDAPVITSSASASGNEDTSISASVVVSDVDNTSFSYSVDTPTKGSVSINSSGLWTYAPSANSNGADSFTVTVFDGAASVAQTISLTVNPVNDAPVITSSASASGNEDTSISASVVVSDVDNTSFSYSVSTPTKGSVSINSSGLWTYAPSANSNGADSFTVTVSDGSGGSVIQTISLTVNPINDAPLITSVASASGNEDTSISASVVVSDVDNTSFSYSVSTPTKGSVSINAAGLWTYAPSVNSNGADSFTVTVFDGSGASVAQTISLTVNPVNDAPIITSSASASGNEDTSISASVVVSDVDNTSFSYSVSTPTKGSVSINSSGLWTYAPSANSNGADIFTVTVFDGSGASVAQTISLTVNPVNDAAIFGGSRSAALTEDAGIYIASGTAIVTDIDGSAEAAFSSTYSAASGNRGSFLFDPANGGWSYSVANANLQSLGAGLTHQDVLHLASVDGTSGSLSVVLTGVDDPAVISGTFSGSVTEDVASTLTVSGQLSVTDVDGAAESLFLTNVTSQNGNRGSLSVTSDGLWTYILDNSLVQPLAENATYIDSFILSSVGGTTTSISVTVFGKADPLGPLSLALGHPQLSLGVLSAAVVDDGTGASVAMLGDVNGDGFDDYLIGQSAISKGAAVLVFGSPSISNLSLASLSASQGITISGATSGDHAGEVVANLGDFTSESSGAIYHDFALGNPDAASGSGSVNILFGKTSAWSSINLASLSTTVGISVTGAGAGAALGSSIAALGDINGDSFADILLGAPGSGNGAAWIVFGKLGDPLVGDYSNINLSSASASTAIAITGSTSASGFGGSAAGLGDVNGDGYADFLVGAAAANEAWLFFGGDGAWNANASLATPPSGAVRLAGVAASGAGHSVSAAGDVNGDGYADFLVASSGLGKVQLIFGKTGTWSGLDLSSLGSAGINLAGAGADAVLSSAGDVNGDGYADFLIGSASQEKSFLIFGKASGWADLDLATLAYPDGCVISSAPGALGGSAVSGGGDVNGDGFDDLLLGRPGSDSAVLISGGDFSDGLAGLIRGSGSFSGTSGADLLIGSTAADTITLLAGADVVHAGAGDDTIVVSSNSFRVIDGGGGTDTVKLSGSSLNLNLSTHGPDAWQGIEAVNLNGSSNRITLALEDALGHTLRINGDESNSVDLDLSQYSGFLRDTAFEDGLHYWFYEHDYLQNAFILIENGIAVV